MEYRIANMAANAASALYAKTAGNHITLIIINDDETLEELIYKFMEGKYWMYYNGGVSDEDKHHIAEICNSAIERLEAIAKYSIDRRELDDLKAEFKKITDKLDMVKKTVN